MPFSGAILRFQASPLQASPSAGGSDFLTFVLQLFTSILVPQSSSFSYLQPNNNSNQIMHIQGDVRDPLQHLV